MKGVKPLHMFPLLENLPTDSTEQINWLVYICREHWSLMFEVVDFENNTNQI